MSSIKSIYIDGSYAYVGGQRYTGAEWVFALFIVDLGTPGVPSLSGWVDLAGWTSGAQPESVAVFGNLAFVAAFNDGLYVVDVSNKAAPVVRISGRDNDLLGQAHDVAVQNRSGTRILAVAGNRATALYTLTGTNSSPVLTLNSSTISGGNSVAFAATGTVLYATSGSFLRAWQTSNPASPVSLSSIQPAVSAVLGKLTVSDARVFVAMNIYGYAVVDASNPSALRTAFVRSVPGETMHVAVGAGYAFVSTGRDYPFRIYGANDPSAARLIHTQSGLRSAARLAAFGGRLYVSEFSGDWTSSVFSLATPAAPVQVSVDQGSYTPYDFAFAGERSFIAAERSGVMQWAIQPPGSIDHDPSVLPPWYISTQGGSAWSITLHGHYALMGTSKSWFNVVDLSRARNASLTVVAAVMTQATESANHEARRIAVAGQFAFVANELAGVRVVDIAKPEFPSVLAGFGATPGQIAAVAAYASYVFAADTVSGLVAYNAADPRNWPAGKIRDWFQPSASPAFDLVIRGSYAYLAYGTAGLGIWEVSNPISPILVGTVQAVGFEPRSLAVYGDYLYATDGASKLYTVSLQP